eukprot:TRINITY_DN2242_c1_g2_i1.p2 TRINITY_DN2242_c1_g2~~TRINITY_DN2242_c1_g2_i1.p2  ORF type:complete len:274 (+),score=76.37 TRINITY_DN2242_c1_g2_i1:53-823(+)
MAVQPAADTTPGQAQPAPETIATLHVSNLPLDFDERELYLLFAHMPGYLNATMMFDPARPPVAFVSFDNEHNAAVSRGLVHGMPWEPYSDQTFKVDTARNKQRIVTSDKHVHSVGTKGPLTRNRALARGGKGALQSMSTGYQPYGGGMGGGVMDGGGRRAGGGGMGPTGFAVQTLYVTMPKECRVPVGTQEDLTDIFQHFHGFVGVKVDNNRAWVRFNSDAAAAAALTAAHGHSAPHTQGHGLCVEYARSELRVDA